MTSQSTGDLDWFEDLVVKRGSGEFDRDRPAWIIDRFNGHTVAVLPVTVALRTDPLLKPCPSSLDHHLLNHMIRDLVRIWLSAHDNAMMESFWARMQVELLNRTRWKTRIELATAIHDYIDLFHNTKRRHSALNMLTPVEFETKHQLIKIAA